MVSVITNFFINGSKHFNRLTLYEMDHILTCKVRGKWILEGNALRCKNIKCNLKIFKNKINNHFSQLYYIIFIIFNILNL